MSPQKIITEVLNFKTLKESDLFIYLLFIYMFVYSFWTLCGSNITEKKEMEHLDVSVPFVYTKRFYSRNAQEAALEKSGGCFERKKNANILTLVTILYILTPCFASWIEIPRNKRKRKTVWDAWLLSTYWRCVESAVLVVIYLFLYTAVRLYDVRCNGEG